MVQPQLEKRQSPRATVLLAAAVGGARLPNAVKLRNLSTTGALIEGEALPNKGSRMLVGFRGRSLRCRVIWVRGGRGGIRFEEPVLFAAAQARRSRPMGQPALASRRPGLKCVPLKASDKLALERWGTMGMTALGV